MNQSTIFRGLNYQGQWRYGHFVIVERLGRLQATIFEIMMPGEGERQSQWPVKEETVGMGTGLKDKNGKEIFEGDVICFNMAGNGKENGVVRWSKRGFWTSQASEIDELLADELLELEAEVIGNIHQNKELLKQTE